MSIGVSTGEGSLRVVDNVGRCGLLVGVTMRHCRSGRYIMINHVPIVSN